mgnify:CR=1 FL=1
MCKLYPTQGRQCCEGRGTVVHCFVASWLDYCNSLYEGLDKSSIQHLQLFQNAALRLVTRKERKDHITPMLRLLHWLPVCHRIVFKSYFLLFKSLNRLAPSYLSELLIIHTQVRELRSATQLLLDKPQTKLVTKGDRTFAVAAPNLWNNLPLHIRSAPSLTLFKSLLKKRTSFFFSYRILIFYFVLLFFLLLLFIFIFILN